MFTYDISRLPFVSMTGRAKEKRGWSHSGRSMQINMLTLIHRGECVFRINETVYSLHAGDSILIPKGTYYKPYTESSCEYTFFHFDGDFEPSPDENPPVQAPDTAEPQSFYGVFSRERVPLYFDYKMNTAEKTQEISLLLSKCVNLRTGFSAMKRTLLSLYFCEILLYVSQSYTQGKQKKSAYPSSLGKMLTFIGENYTRQITLDEICSSANVSKQYCMRLFKKHMNMTANEYILGMRMKHAAYLLRHTYMNVAEVTDYLGYSSVSYFSRVFKGYFGVPPSNYKE